MLPAHGSACGARFQRATLLAPEGGQEMATWVGPLQSRSPLTSQDTHGRSGPCRPAPGRPLLVSPDKGEWGGTMEENGRHDQILPLDSGRFLLATKRRYSRLPCPFINLVICFASSVSSEAGQGQQTRYLEVPRSNRLPSVFQSTEGELPKNDVTDSYRAQCDQGPLLLSPIARAAVAGALGIGQAPARAGP